MGRSIAVIYTGIILILLLVNCSENKLPLTNVSHPDNWNKKDSENFHGTKVIAAGYMSCKSCHGDDLKGGKTDYSCFQCHQTYPHPDEWNYITNSKFHGAYITANNSNTDYCKGCHGADYKGGKSGISCYACHSTNSLP